VADASLLRAHVTKRFGGLAALDAVSLTIGAGEVCGLIGPNGAGKTTLVNVLSGVLRPTAGSISFAGGEIAGSPPYVSRGSGSARTFQTLRIFPELSVLENVAVGYHAHTRRRDVGHERGGGGCAPRDTPGRARGALTRERAARLSRSWG